jgi:sodium/potassium-transporting ATPase subunit alpha
MQILNNSAESLSKRSNFGEERLDYHKISFEELISRFNTSLENGLDNATAQQILIKNGKNKITIVKKQFFFKLIGYLFAG